LGWVLFQGTQLLINQMSLFRSVCKWQKSVKTVKDIMPSLKQAMQVARSGHSSSVAASRLEEQALFDEEEQALIDEEERDLEELEAVDSVNLIRDLAVDAERVLSDWTDAHMNDLVSGCGCSRAGATEFVAEVPAHAHACVAHNARFSSEDESGDESWNITTCRDIPSDMLIDLTSDNTRVCKTESSFGKSDQRPSNDLVNIRNIPSTAAENIPMGIFQVVVLGIGLIM
jgi:hypothetical protein